MAWNEPGGSKDKDPWGGGQGDGQGPPDLDDVVRKLQEKFSGIFGGKGGGGRGGGSGRGASLGISTLILVVLGLWALSGLYIIDEGKRGVVLRFGDYTQTVQAGLHWHIPFPIETVEVVDVEQIRSAEIGFRSGAGGQSVRPVPREALMLTQDENIIDIKLAVQYRVQDAPAYLFNVRNPDETLHQATESALREVIGKSKMDFALTEGRSEIVARTNKVTQEILDNYETGLVITSVNMQDAQPPEQVQDAFNDAVKAREDEVRLRNEAEAYSNDILPKARGGAARIVEEASAYQEQVIARAEGDVSRFEQILTEYKQAPGVTRERLYLDAMESILTSASKVMIDVKEGNNLLFLPLDRLVSGEIGDRTGQDMSEGQDGNQSGQLSSSSMADRALDRARSALRSREVR